MKIKTDIMSCFYILPAKTASKGDEYNLQAPNRNDLDRSQNELNHGTRDGTAYTRNHGFEIRDRHDQESDAGS